MNLDVALVITVGGIVGSILITQMWQMNYFKRENFKFSLAQQKRADSIKFRKLERDLGIKKGKQAQTDSNQSIVDVLTNLDLDKIKGLSSLVQKGEDDDIEEEEGSDDLIENILSYAKENPEIANQFLKQLNPGGEQKQEIKYLGD